MQWCHTPRASATQRRDEDTRETAGEVAARGPLTMEAGEGREEPGEATFYFTHFCLTWVLKANSCPFYN